MKRLYQLLVVVMMVGIAFLLPGSAVAQGSTGDEVVVGGTYTLKSGETLDGNLFVIGGNALLKRVLP